MSAKTVTNSAIRIAMVEDDDLVRESMKLLLAGEPGYSCVAAYSNARDAIANVRKARPDVMLVDINLPGMSGIQCVREIKKILPATQMVMLTMFEDDDMVFESLRAGASGYLLKRTPRAEILSAIAEVHRGGSPMSSSIARKVVRMIGGLSAARPHASAELELLSAREKEVLEQLAGGRRYKEIAVTLGISVETVRTHLRRIYEKLHVTSRTEAAVKFLAG